MALLRTLPSHLVGQILDKLETKERARLAVVSKAWRAISEMHWSVIKLSFSTLHELELLRAWLDSLVRRGLHGSAREFELFWKGGKLLHPASNSLHIECFVGLSTLRLKPPKSAWWALNSRAVERLAPLVNLKLLELAFIPSCAARTPIVTLKEFAAFPKLQDLTVVVVSPKSPVTYRLRLAPQLEGLRDLRALSVHGLEVWEITATAHHIVRRLTHLAFAAGQGLKMHAESGDASLPLKLEAPRLQHLTTRANCIPEFAFTSMENLRVLRSMDGSLPRDLSVLSGLEKVVLGWQVRMTQAVSECLEPLRRLKEATISHYVVDTQESFAGLSHLKRLEKLTISLVSSREEGVMCIRPELWKLASLQMLRIFTGCPDLFILDAEFDRYPALEALFLENLSVLRGLSSSTLLSICYAATEQPKEATRLPRLNSLPKLQDLELRFSQLLEKEMDTLLHDTAALPRLQKLVMCKLAPSRAPSHGTFERLFCGLKQLKELDILQVTAIFDNISLSRKTLPAAKHFGLACNGLSVCASCLPFESRSMDFVFSAANRATLELLDDAGQVYHDLLSNRKVTRARYPWNAQMPCHFGNDVFDPEEWQERMDELALA